MSLFECIFHIQLNAFPKALVLTDLQQRRSCKVLTAMNVAGFSLVHQSSHLHVDYQHEALAFEN